MGQLFICSPKDFFCMKEHITLVILTLAIVGLMVLLKEKPQNQNQFHNTRVMNVCNKTSDKCSDLSVELNNTTVKRIYFSKDTWVAIYHSDCYKELCFAVDENNTEWVLQFI